jgi:hypothetical protein
MKVFILNTPALLQPGKQALQYPVHNKDYGIEQDFNIWINKQKNIVTDNPSIADWHYLPVYWTRWHINHHFAANGEGLNELQREVDKVIIDGSKTFTITQFDGGTLIDTGKATVFTAGRTVNEGIDVPTLCSKHRKPPVPLKKKYIASFNGSFTTHPVRVEMEKRFEGNPAILIQGPLPTRFYKRWFWGKNYNLNMMASYVALSPRGTNCTSFRFFEAMQFGVAPCLIGDIDVRPFKKFIPWDEMSYYVASVDDLENLLKNLDKKEALKKGKKAYQYWKNEIYYQKWCKYVLKELEEIKTSMTT